jgi:antitoxin MazE
MEAVIRKWGNSPAVRLNLAAMKAAAFDIEQHVTIKATRGRIVIEPSKKLDFKLDDLIAGITRSNTHGEVDFGGPVGRETL